MALAAGVAKKLVVAKESVWGTAVAAGGTSQYLRRTESTIALERDPFQSNEIRSDFQIADYRLGTKRVSGAVNGELGLGSYSLFQAAALRKDFAVGGSYTAGVGTGITSDSATKTFTRAGGSWITDGFRIGHTVRFSNLAATANNGVNYRIVGLTATVMTVAEAVTTDAVADETCSCTTVGKVSFIPTSGHTSDSFTIEHNFSDIDLSEYFTGCRVSNMRVDLPATGLATCGFDVMGKDGTVVTGASAPYFTAPSAAGTGALLAAVNGTLRLGGTDIAVVTGANFTLDLGMTGDAVVGSNTLPALFYGRSNVTGQLTAYFEDATLLNAFINETELELYMTLTDTSSPAGFISFYLPRVKLSGATKNDGEGGLIQTLPFQALLKPATTGYEQTTLLMQDSSLV